jgi:hypothetical protein
MKLSSLDLLRYSVILADPYRLLWVFFIYLVEDTFHISSIDAALVLTLAFIGWLCCVVSSSLVSGFLPFSHYVVWDEPVVSYLNRRREQLK